MGHPARLTVCRGRTAARLPPRERLCASRYDGAVAKPSTARHSRASPSVDRVRSSADSVAVHVHRADRARRSALNAPGIGRRERREGRRARASGTGRATCREQRRPRYEARDAARR